VNTLFSSAPWRRILVPLLILIAAALAGVALIKTEPRAHRRRPPRIATLVQVTPVHLSTQSTAVYAMGTVIPAHETVLSARVGAQIIAVSPEFVPGGRFQAGEIMVRLDSADFVLAVRQRRSALEQARSAYRLEMGQQGVARAEYALLDTPLGTRERDLVLRGPQLQSAEAVVTAARAALEGARLDLERTTVRAPFNAVVLQRLADVGTQVTPATPLARLVGTDAFWADAAVPVDQLKWIDIPSSASRSGSRAYIRSRAAWGDSTFRTGRVIRQRIGLEEKGRMARVLIQVDDPLGFRSASAGAPRLILSSYVEVEIQGRPVDSVAVIPRPVLRDGDQVWLMKANRTLEFRSVQVIFRGRDTVYARGLSEGERLVITDLAAPVEGMPLRVAAGPSVGPGNPAELSP